MGRWGLRWTVGLALVVVAVAVSAQAAAEGEVDSGAFGAFRLEGTHGYSILVLATSQRGFRHGEVLAFADRKGEGAVYIAPAMVTEGTIEARLRGVGTISVQFEPRGERKRERARCEGGGTIDYQPGYWVGTVEFRGEEGFTRAEATRTPALVDPFSEIGCRTVVSAEESGHGLPGARLVARSAMGRRTTFLQANANRPDGRLKLDATIEERKPRLTITRLVERRYPGGDFRFNPRLRSAVLRPAAPFSGVGVFRRDARPRNRWTGSLSVDFPGHASVALTGSSFRATLAHARVSRGHSSPDRPRGPNLSAWPSTKLSPTASATSSLLGPS